MADTKPNQDMLAQVQVGVGAGAGAGGQPAVPTAQPPSAGSGAVGAAGVGAGAVGASVWVNNKKVNALWAINENRNSWIGVAGVGWVKLANNSDSAIVAFTMLGANARLTQGDVSYRQEADGMIHEIYVW